jgi:hypothetical protein
MIDGIADHSDRLGFIYFSLIPIDHRKSHGPKPKSRNLKIEMAERSILHGFVFLSLVPK